jgi:16S rRNA (cytosine967-C5)-methyltransferase
LEATADLVGLVLKFDHPADQVVSRFFRDHREFGPRERATLAETVYTVLRKKLLFDHLSPSGSGSKERRMAILGFHGPRDFLKSALNDTEKRWLDNCDAVKPEDLLERHRHNLPEWLVAPLKAQLGDGFWPLVESLQQPAPLDLRVNALTDKRAEVKAELAKAAIKSEVTPFSPWGLRIDGKPALTKLDAFARGAVEVQDEGSQLLALLLDAKRGEMVVDFCAAAGSMPSTRRRTGSMRSSRGWRAASSRMFTRRPLRTSATTASSAWPARSTGCWSTLRARAWERCAAIPT